LKASGKAQIERSATTTARALRSVLAATGGQAKVEELYKLLTAEQAATFLGLAEQTVCDMTYRHELPHTKVGVRGVRYRLIDLIAWSEQRSYPSEVDK
jgi:excisionase family DNA binding protein